MNFQRVCYHGSMILSVGILSFTCMVRHPLKRIKIILKIPSTLTTMLSDPEGSRPAKRQKTAENPPSPSTHRKDATFWFEDGNVVLVSNQRTEFRVHLGVLSFNADFFRDMAGLAVPDKEERGYTTIEVADSTQDLTHFLHALYTRSLVFTVFLRFQK